MFFFFRVTIRGMPNWVLFVFLKMTCFEKWEALDAVVILLLLQAPPSLQCDQWSPLSCLVLPYHFAFFTRAARYSKPCREEGMRSRGCKSVPVRPTESSLLIMVLWAFRMREKWFRAVAELGWLDRQPGEESVWRNRLGSEFPWCLIPSRNSPRSMTHCSPS